MTGHRAERAEAEQAARLPTHPGLLLALLGITWLVDGYHLHYDNQHIQLSLIRWLNDRSLFPHDPFCATLGNYCSLLWYLVAALTRILPIPTVLLAGFVACKLLLFVSAGRLALAFGPASRLEVLATMGFFALAPRPILGGGTLAQPYFEQTGLFIPCFLFAVAAWRHQRRAAWAIWLALGFSINSLYGTYALTYFAAAWAVDREQRAAWRGWLKALALFVMLSLPAVWATLAALSEPTRNPALYSEVLRGLLPLHLFPSTWPARRWLRSLVLLVLLLLAVRSRRRDLPRLPLFAAAWTAAGLAWLALGFVAERVDVPVLLVAHPSRATDLWFAIAAPLVLAAGLRRRADAPANTAAVALLVALPVIVWRPAATAVLAVLLLSACLPRVRQTLDRRPRRAGAWLLAALLLAGLGQFAVRARDTSPSRALYDPGGPALLAVADWANRYTARDAVFLIPPRWHDFRAMSRRPVFTTWRDGCAALWDRSYLPHWLERVAALGAPYQPEDYLDPTRDVYEVIREYQARLGETYRHLSDAQVAALAERFGVRYWVIEGSAATGYPEVFRTDGARVVRLAPGADRL